MAVKKKNNKPAARTKATGAKSKARNSESKALKTTAGKEALKKPAAISGKSKNAARDKGSKTKKPKESVIHGPDLHLIPVTGELHPARRDEAAVLEKAFKHNEEIALHREQQRSKNILAQGGGRRIFKNPRQS